MATTKATSSYLNQAPRTVAEVEAERAAQEPVYHTCPTCQYASRTRACDNPGCRANPSVSPAQIARWDAEADKRNVEEAERERIRKIRQHMYPGR